MSELGKKRKTGKVVQSVVAVCQAMAHNLLKKQN
jgi:hypothetical protein